MNAVEWWEELLAQIDEHGTEEVVFCTTGDDTVIFTINNVMFDDGKIFVELQPEGVAYNV